MKHRKNISKATKLTYFIEDNANVITLNAMTERKQAELQEYFYELKKLEYISNSLRNKEDCSVEDKIALQEDIKNITKEIILLALEPLPREVLENLLDLELLEEYLILAITYTKYGNLDNVQEIFEEQEKAKKEMFKKEKKTGVI